MRLPHFSAALSFVLALLFSSITATAQKGKADDFHDPAFFLKVLADSKQTYNIGDTMPGSMPCPERADKVLANDFFQEEKDGSLLLRRYELKPAEEAIFEKAEKAFAAEEHDTALAYYGALLKLRPDFSPALVYTGQVQRLKGDYAAAEAAYRKAIEQNYISYMAHWFYGSLLARRGAYKEGMREMALAWVLNRNNPRLLNDFKAIAEDASLRVKDWCFVPQILLTKEESGDVGIRFGSAVWLSYALAKAVWKYEPKFREKYGDKDGEYNHREEKECLLNLCYGILVDSSETYTTDPALVALKKAMDAKMVDEYLLMEITAPRYPRVALTLPRKQIEEMADYMLLVRTAK